LSGPPSIATLDLPAGASTRATAPGCPGRAGEETAAPVSAGVGSSVVDWLAQAASKVDRSRVENRTADVRFMVVPPYGAIVLQNIAFVRMNIRR
jgi:hypothetical protein